MNVVGTDKAENSAMQRVRDAERKVRDAERELEIAKQDAIDIVRSQFFSFDLTRSRTIEETTTVVVEAMLDETLEQAEERLQAWLSNPNDEEFDDLDWEEQEDLRDDPYITGSGGVLEDFDPDLETVTVPIEDDDAD